MNGPTKYDICKTAEITASSGTLISPNYPSYMPIPSPCQTKLVAPAGKTFNIYTADVSLVVRNKNEE